MPWTMCEKCRKQLEFANLDEEKAYAGRRIPKAGKGFAGVKKGGLLDFATGSLSTNNNR